jgi:ABC-type sugar transport system substrate-binding protein
MTFNHDDDEDVVSRRHALRCMLWVGTGVLGIVSAGGSKSFGQSRPSQAASGAPQAKPTIPVIVKDKTSVYWQTVLAGARRAGQDLGVIIFELGTNSESDINGQIGILANAVASSPSAIVIAPAQFAALAKPIENAARQVKIIGIDAVVDSSPFTSFVKADNVQAGRLAADVLADAIKRTYADAEATWPSSPHGPVSRRSKSAPGVSRSKLPRSTGPWTSLPIRSAMARQQLDLI